MKVTVRAFGPIMEIIGRIINLDLAPGSTLDDLARRLETDARLNDEIKILGSNMTILVNGVNSKTLKNLALKEGDRIDILSPFGGG